MFLTIVINIDPNLFQIGPLLITWHGVFSVLGILGAARLGLWLLAKDDIDVSRGADGVTWMVLLGLVGARALYVWENFKLFSGQLLHIFYITEGGISQWGGLFGAILGAYVWARRARFSFWKVIDAGRPAAGTARLAAHVCRGPRRDSDPDSASAGSKARGDAGADRGDRAGVYGGRGRDCGRNAAGGRRDPAEPAEPETPEKGCGVGARDGADRFDTPDRRDRSLPTRGGGSHLITSWRSRSARGARAEALAGHA